MAQLERIHPETREEWRRWLEAHHDESAGIDLVQWRTATGKPRLRYEDIVEEALCFGWIDSRYHRLDEERSTITMTPRRPRSVWARSNKERVERLTAAGRMAPAGLRAVEAAKASGAWSMLDDVEDLVVPDDLAAALAAHGDAPRHFEGFPPSSKKQLLYWVKSARRPETRQRRIAEAARLAADGICAPARPGEAKQG